MKFIMTAMIAGRRLKVIFIFLLFKKKSRRGNLSGIGKCIFVLQKCI